MRAETPQSHSYADTTIGVVYFNVALPNEGPLTDTILSIASRRKESEEARAEHLAAVLRYVGSYHRSLWVHEWCHILQAISYPALYLRCVRESRVMHASLFEIRRNPEKTFPRWLPLADHVMRTLLSSSYTFRIKVSEDGTASIDQSDPSDRRPNDLSEIDLLEEDASVFQYKVEIGGTGTGAGYSRWLREKRRYTMVYRFLSRVLGAEGAYTALQPLVRAAYQTTYPIATFTRLLASTVYHDSELPLALGADDYYDQLLEWLERSNDYDRTVPQMSRAWGDDQSSYLAADSIAAIIRNSQDHILQPLAEKLFGKTGGDPRKPDWFLHPYRHFNRHTGKVSEEMEEYSPPLVAVRLLHPKLAIADTVLSFSTLYSNLDHPALPGSIAYVDTILQFMQEKHFTFSLSIPPYLDTAHNCPHTGCRFFPLNMCRRWHKIPETPEACTFPEEVEQMTCHRLDPTTETLVPLAGAHAN